MPERDEKNFRDERRPKEINELGKYGHDLNGRWRRSGEIGYSACTGAEAVTAARDRFKR